MSFLDSEFLWFLPLSLALWWGMRQRPRLRIGTLVAMSLVFYGYDEPLLVLIILAYCLVDWACGLAIAGTNRPRLALSLGVGFNLAVLGFWKYTPLVAASLNRAIGWPVGDASIAISDGWVLPLGVSFYGFMGIAYMVDVYRGATKPERNPVVFALFTVFFAHLVSGPILRAKEFLVDLGPEALPDRPAAVWEGSFLVARGYFKKTVLGDGIAFSIDPFFAAIGTGATTGVWALPYLYLYSLQIYFDFSGYTDIARGIGLWFGFRWPENFNWPYLARSIQEFWRRWHMTLSRFLRDYLYIPLGGSHGGKVVVARNLLITMALGGLWHGANWSFLVWGMVHGLMLVAHWLWRDTALARRLAVLNGLPGGLWAALGIILTFNAVTLAWAFFRIPDFADAVTCLGQVFAFDPGRIVSGGVGDAALWLLLGGYGLVVAGAAIATRAAPLASVGDRFAGTVFGRGFSIGIPVGLFALSLLLSPEAERPPFIYFQF